MPLCLADCIRTYHAILRKELPRRLVGGQLVGGGAGAEVRRSCQRFERGGFTTNRFRKYASDVATGEVRSNVRQNQRDTVAVAPVARSILCRHLSSPGPGNEWKETG